MIGHPYGDAMVVMVLGNSRNYVELLWIGRSCLVCFSNLWWHLIQVMEHSVTGVHPAKIRRPSSLLIDYSNVGLMLTQPGGYENVHLYGEIR